MTVQGWVDVIKTAAQITVPTYDLLIIRDLETAARARNLQSVAFLDFIDTSERLELIADLATRLINTDREIHTVRA